MDEYQKKRLTEITFRNRLILKDMIWVVKEEQDQSRQPKKRKRDQSCRTPSMALPKHNDIKDITKVKEPLVVTFGLLVVGPMLVIYGTAARHRSPLQALSYTYW